MNYWTDMEKSIKQRLEDEGLLYTDEVFMPDVLDKGFVGIAETDWHWGRPIYDLSKLTDVEIPETPEGLKEPIFFTPGFNREDFEGVLFAPEEGLNQAIVGVTDQDQAVYEHEALANAMMFAENWDDEDAEDWISANTLRDYSYRDRGPVVYDGHLIEYILEEDED